MRKAELDSYKQNMDLRRTFSNKIFILLVCWVIAIFALLVLQGFGSKYDFFNLSDKVLMTFLGATSASVIGVFLLVTKYLFNTKKSKEE